MESFRDIIGHVDEIQYLQQSIETGKVSHAYLIRGPKGSGKKKMAEAFAMALQCETNKTDACKECHSCKQALSNNHPDIIYLQHEKPATIGVDDVRVQINDTVQIRPYSSNYKIYIIEDADKMTVQAQNAILKTIEEPPEYVVMILLTSNRDSLLPTILSRCVELRLRPVNGKLIKKYLMEALHVPDYKADICVAFAQGNVGKAVKLVSSENFNELKDDAVKLLKYINDLEINEIIDAIKNISNYKVDIEDYLDMIMIWYRDVLLFKATNSMEGIIFREEMEHIKKRASKSSYNGIERILEALETAKIRLKSNVNFELTMELLLVTIKEN